MPWLVGTVKDAGSLGVTGTLRHVTPTTSTRDPSEFFEMPLPETVSIMDERWSTGDYGGQKYLVGGGTENVVITKDWKVWIQGIRPPTSVPDVALVAGPGITSDNICYLAFYDINTDEWSDLSVGTPTLSAANQQLEWTLTDVEIINPRVTHIGLFRSTDGSLPRLVMIRQVGVTVVTEATALGDLGFAVTDSWDRFERCRYNEVWHDRQVMSGDDQHPTAIYLSLVGFPERQSSLSLSTKSGQKVVGLVVVRDTLVVLCQRASEIISGYTEDDLSIEIAQSQIGCVSHHGVVVIHGMAWIPTHLGYYLCDGAGWFFGMKDVSNRWIREYKTFPNNYERMWAVHDPVRQALKAYVGDHVDVGASTYWIASYPDTLSILGGTYGQPKWSYDSSERGYSAAGVLGVPGSSRVDLFTGTDAITSIVYRENDATDLTDDDDVELRTADWYTGAMTFGEEGGHGAKGKLFTDLTVWINANNCAFRVRAYGGGDTAVVFDPQFNKEEPASFKQTITCVPDDINPNDSFLTTTTYEPRARHHFTPAQLVGEALTVRITVVSPTPEVRFSGLGIGWRDGHETRNSLSVTEFQENIPCV